MSGFFPLNIFFTLVAALWDEMPFGLFRFIIRSIKKVQSSKLKIAE